MSGGRGSKIVVLGMMSKMPVAGIVWLTVQYLVGLARLGYEPYYVEAHARTPSMLMEDGDDDAGSARAAAFIDGVARRFDLGPKWAFHALHGDGRCYGMSESRLKKLYSSAALVVNLHGGTQPPPEEVDPQRLILVETDPVQLQIELHERRADTEEFVASHGAVFTWAENYGQPDCGLPTFDRFPFQRTRQPIVLDLWERLSRRGPRYTTIANWRQEWRDLAFNGEIYTWSKHYEFLKVLALPRLTQAKFELALSGFGAEDERVLRENGWAVRDGLVLSRDPDVYREYIVTSRAEFTVAKDQNVRLRTGWFSDRSATYLAAGKPVVTQDTGFGSALPTGAGLFAFTTLDDAVASVEELERAPLRHGRAALDIARECFDSDRVLGDLLDTVGLQRRHTRSARKENAAESKRGRSLRVLLVSHRYPPDSVAGVERYTESLAHELVSDDTDVAVLTRRPTSAAEPVDIVEDGFTAEVPVRVFRVTGGDVRRERFLYHDARLESLFEEFLEIQRPDVVHFNHVIDLSPRLLEVAHRRAAVVLTLHDYYFACPRIILQKPSGRICAGPDGGRECARTCFADEVAEVRRRWQLRTAYFRRLLAVPDRVLCPSEYVATYFRAFAPDAHAIEALPNGTLIARAAACSTEFSTPPARGTLRVAVIGAVMPHKGARAVVDALRRAALPAVDLTLFGDVGDAAYAASVRRDAADVPGLRLRLYGAYDPRDLPLLLYDVDCVIVPSQWPETFGLVTREALALGIPVVVTRLGALAEPVIDGVNGFTVSHDRPDQLASVLSRLASDEPLLRRLRTGAQRTPLLSVADHAASIRAVYLEAVAEHDARAAPPGDGVELELLHSSLVAAGFGPPQPDDSIDLPGASYGVAAS